MINKMQSENIRYHNFHLKYLVAYLMESVPMYDTFSVLYLTDDKES